MDELLLKSIQVERESVCMGDDCNAPNGKKITFTENELLSEFMESVARYVPTMNSSVWSVTSNGKTIAYLIFDKNGNYTIESNMPDNKVSELKLNKLFCKYYYDNKMLYLSDNNSTEIYEKCGTLLEKVKAYENKFIINEN